MGSVSLQWSLDQTSQNIVGITTGLLRAASSDNVQILALLACERFGATLAMSPESCHKAFLLCDQTHSSVLSFVKLQVGYMKGDSGYQLARSDAGIRFLGLAACLSTLNPWNAAVILHDLISKTARDRTMVPSAQQLKQLVLALQARLSRSGFCESVVGWSRIFMDELDDHDSRIEVPTDKAIGALVTALSHTARLGDENSKVRISTPSAFAAWIIAFVKWCLGQPPRIIFENGRTRGLDSDSQVSVQFRPGAYGEVRVETYDHVGNLKDLVSDQGPSHDLKGLVSVRTYGQSKLRKRFGAPTTIQYRACLQALPYACSFFRTHYNYLLGHNSLYGRPAAYGESKAVPGQAFPSEQKIYQVIHEYQGATSDRFNVALPVLGEQRLTDLSLVSLAHSQLSQSCACGDCSPSGPGYCQVQTMYKGIIACVADVLILSLFQPIDPEGVKVWYSFMPRGRSFRDSVSELMFGDGGKTNTVQVTQKDDFLNETLDYAIGLLGHALNDERWIMSSYHGQTIYPLSFSSQMIEQSGILRLCCIPGTIMWNDERYSFVRSARPSFGGHHALTGTDPSILLTPRNNFAHHVLKWEIYPADTGIEAGISLPDFPTMAQLDPRRIFKSSLFSIYVNCSHEKRVAFHPDGLEIFECPPHIQPKVSNAVYIIQADNNERIRHATLASDFEFVIRMQACLECCIRCSVLNGLRRVIC